MRTKKTPLSSFRLVVARSADSDLRGRGDCTLASDAFALYRRLGEASQWTVEIFDLRAGCEKRITGAELEALAACEQKDHR
jgi:hypothetical protein